MIIRIKESFIKSHQIVHIKRIENNCYISDLEQAFLYVDICGLVHLKFIINIKLKVVYRCSNIANQLRIDKSRKQTITGGIAVNL